MATCKRTYFISRKGSRNPARFNGELQMFDSKAATLQFIKEWCAEKLVEAGKNTFTDSKDFTIFCSIAGSNAVCMYDDMLFWFVTYHTSTYINTLYRSNPDVDNSLEMFVSRFLQFYDVRYKKGLHNNFKSVILMNS